MEFDLPHTEVYALAGYQKASANTINAGTDDMVSAVASMGDFGNNASCNKQAMGMVGIRRMFQACVRRSERQMFDARLIPQPDQVGPDTILPRAYAHGRMAKRAADVGSRYSFRKTVAQLK